MRERRRAREKVGEIPHDIEIGRELRRRIEKRVSKFQYRRTSLGWSPLENHGDGLVFRATKLPVYYELTPGIRWRQLVLAVPKPMHGPGIGKHDELVSTDLRRTAPRWLTPHVAAIRTSRPSARSIPVYKPK